MQALDFTRARAFARLPAPQKQAFVASLTDAESIHLNYSWPAWARTKQLPPAWDWAIWLILAGRGYGKTRVGAEWIRSQAESNQIERMALIGRTAADVRDVMVEGESGLLAVSHPFFRPRYEPSKRRLTWPNGATATTFSADEPDALRGPQHQKIWMDEPAAWRFGQDAYDQAMFGLRLRPQPQAVLTTTPRPIALIKRLVAEAGSTVALTRGTTYENLSNLAPTFVQQVVGRYQNTRLGLQELEAQLLDDNPGALWNREMLDRNRVTRHPELVRVVVGIDPSVHDGNDLSNDKLAEAGIIVAGLGTDGHGYILGDYSLQGSPFAWATAGVAAYHLHQADRVIGEANNGGALVEVNIRTVDPDISYESVHAARGKQTRAEPVASLYEQARIHHVGLFGPLEDQQCQWVPGEKSPDRLDALVWAITKLMLDKQEGGGLVMLPAPTAQELASVLQSQEQDTTPWW